MDLPDSAQLRMKRTFERPTFFRSLPPSTERYHDQQQEEVEA